MSVSIRNIVHMALFAALFIVMSMIKIPLPFTPVPVTLQNLAVMLAGAFLGARGGFLGIGLVIALTALGLPLLHGQGGLSYVLGPTGGFLLAFPFCAAAVGWCTGKLFHTRLHRTNRILFTLALFFIFLVCGSLLSYLAGLPWLARAAGLSFAGTIAAGFAPFIGGDIVKSVIAAVIVSALAPHVIALRGRMRSSRAADAGLPADGTRAG
jgi:biotin transport system substrate-specific component